MVKVLIGVVVWGKVGGVCVCVCLRDMSFKQSPLYTFNAIAVPHHMTLRLGHALSSLFHAGQGLLIRYYNPTEFCQVVRSSSDGSWRSWLFFPAGW